MDGTLIAQKILSCVFRLKGGFGVKHVVDVLKGSAAQHILTRRHEELSTYGLMKECSETELRYYIDSLILQGLLTKSPGDYPLLQWTDSSQSVIRGERKVLFRKRLFKKAKELVEVKTSSLQSADSGLFERLRALRKRLAQEEKVAAYMVFSDKSLLEMASFAPQTKEAFLEINGVGPLKAEKYSDAFLGEISAYKTAHNGS
jgi:ATP-dependent DNA helicase RecQ